MPILVRSSAAPGMSWEESSDRELMKSLQDDEEGALDELVERKSPGLSSVVARMLGDAEETRDIVQVTFVRVWEHRHKYRDRWSPNTWIYRIATNLTIDHLRARQRRNQAMVIAGSSLRAVDGERRSLAELQQSEVGEVLLELLDCLSDRQRAVFLLRAVEGFDTKEVAAIVGCRASTVRNHLFAARGKLKRELEIRFPEYSPGSPVEPVGGER